MLDYVLALLWVDANCWLAFRSPPLYRWLGAKKRFTEDEVMRGKRHIEKYRERRTLKSVTRL